MAKLKAQNQVIMTGIVTEADILASWYSRIGHKGGSARTEKQMAHRYKSMAAINARKKARAAARKEAPEVPSD